MSEDTIIINRESMLPVGTLLQGGKYRIDRYLASGGFGNTYVVTNLYFEETYAMKEFFMKDLNLRDNYTVTISMPDKRPLFEAHRNKFIKEARRLRKLRDKHIIQVHDLFEENGTAYYIMDFISGESLKTRMSRLGRPMTEEEVFPILHQALDALDTVHQEQIWHLDIKPDNIMIDAKGKLYLIDFGASKQLHTVDGYTLNTSFSIALTHGYAPLEQIEQNLRLCGPWTDLYALGATLYKLLTNYSIPSPTELLYGTQLTFPPTVSQQMQELINWMMKPIYSQRPQSAAEVRSFLDSHRNNGESSIVVEPDNNPAEETVLVSGIKNDSGVMIEQDDKSLVHSDDSIVTETSMLNEEENIPVNEKDELEHDSRIDKNDEIITVKGFSFKMKFVKGGTFTMGATPEQESEAYDSEKPAHKVVIDSFYIGETVVTQNLWNKVMGTNPSFFRGTSRPVECVSWIECQDFIRELNSMTGLTFRLPTEAEWEYAARGGNYSKGHKYSGSSAWEKVAWCGHAYKGKTHDVATKIANELGIYDMSGNVNEWCQDRFGAYNNDNLNNPQGSSSGSKRVFRGGSWKMSARGCRVSFRGVSQPSYFSDDLGLRLAMGKKDEI